MENMLDKLIITALRGKTAAVLFKDGHAAQIDFEPEAAEDSSRVMIQRTELKAALENAEKAGGFRVRSRKPRTQEKPEKQANG